LATWILLSLLLALSSPAAQNDADGTVLFENRIRPLLIRECFDCHSANAKKLKGGLRLDTRDDILKGGDSGPAIISGDAEGSLLIKAVRHSDKDLAMPRGPQGSKTLNETEIADLVRWVNIGAPYPDLKTGPAAVANSHWSFQPIQNPPAPLVKNVSWPRTSIDAFILAKLEANGHQPAAPADKRTLIRRATFDLTGLPPTPEEIDAFLADPSPEAFATVVDRLLNSPHYGEQWGRHWLDVVRYADTAGDTADYPVPVAWRYRNYVIDAFNADKPYDQFIREQVAGDLLAQQGPHEKYAERVTATGFLAISRRFGFDSENYHHLTIQDTIDTLGQSVLGLTLGCARCHNHKYDPVTSSEYYGLYGIFESTRYAFPGSEQKAKVRVLSPLLPPQESQRQWRAFEDRIAAMGIEPSALLRSLDDLDGDFEIQRPAAGGSKGVLVPPWVYEGALSVTPQAQSPFKNLHAFGNVGVNVAASTNGYHLEQMLHPFRTRGLLHVNLDFRVATNGASGHHHLWLGSQGRPPAVEVLISSDAISFPAGRSEEKILLPQPGQWHNLQLTLDLDTQTFSGTVGLPGKVTTFAGKPFSVPGPATINFVAIGAQGSGLLPDIDIDNIGVQELPIQPVSISFTSTEAPAAALKSLSVRLEKLAGLDGDFELQKDGAAPVKPWHPGPGSVVKISSASQSPYRNIFPPGELGIHLPSSAGYNGFGQTLTNHWKAAVTEHLFACFDFRCDKQESNEEGSWRFHLGHSHQNPAVELSFNDRAFFKRSEDHRDSVMPLRSGQWYQVQLALDLKRKTYSGSIATPEERTEFNGQFPRGWDGSIDYTFIDTGGHIPGVKPSLEVDNFSIGETPLPPLSAKPLVAAVNRNTNSMFAAALRHQIAELITEVDKSKQELAALLDAAPFDMAYGVAEGTPRNSRLQIRGEPEKLGEEVPRGFLKILGDGPLPKNLAGSGRLELAQWLTRPENPLTPRVMVNRLWQYHFGNGLVKTPNDFGLRGQSPTHPELLDYLATRFIQSGWSIKAMHRLIMASAVYQQSSRNSDLVSSELVKTLDSTPETLNTGSVTKDFFAPFPRRRFSAEELRDSILFVSGELDPMPGRTHPFPAPTSWGYTQHNPFYGEYEHNKRSVYLMTQRIKRHPFLALFDGADPNASTADRRPTTVPTTVPTQALFFLNDPVVHDKARKFAARLQDRSAGKTDQIQLAYRLAFGRLPSDQESTEATEFLSAYRTELSGQESKKAETEAWAAYARVLFGSNEFLTVD